MSDKLKIINNNGPKLEIIKLSASSMKTFDQCPKKYFYTYIERVPRKQWDHFDLGNLCHKTLEIFHSVYMEDAENNENLTNLMGYAFSKAREEFKEVGVDIITEAKKLVQGYLDLVNTKGMPNVKGVETSFNFNLSEDIMVRGFLDRIDLMNDDMYHIVDYKTTKNEKYLEPFQLLVYGLWLQKEHPEVDNFKASYILLRHDSKLKSYDFNKYDVEKAKEKILDFASKIKTAESQEQWIPIPTPLCNWCDFKDICPTQKGW